MTQTDSAVLDVEELKVSFATSRGPVHAIDRVSMSIARGEVIGVVGESGSGKSATALAAMGLLPDSATVTAKRLAVSGESMLGRSEKEFMRIRGQRIAMVFQDPMTSLNPVMRVGEQIAETLRRHRGLTRAQAKERAIELIDLVGIREPQRHYRSFPHELSGGMRQRIGIAIAVCCEPALLIADEPTTALDVSVQSEIVALVDRLRRDSGMAVMWISHDLGLIAGLVDRVVVMYAGHVVEVAPVHEIFERPRHPYTQGLLASLPRIDAHPAVRLASIPGAAPDLRHRPEGCQFRNRCPHAIPQCLSTPGLTEAVGVSHLAACWVKPTDTDWAGFGSGGGR